MIKTGLDILIEERLALLKGRRVGLATHPAAVRPDLTGAVDALRQAGVRLTALFGPEHGFSGAIADGAAVDDGLDGRTRLPVYSLYGQTQQPTAAMLADVDVLVFDMQDVGVRFYTFASTLVYVLKGAAQAGKPVVVLDRPNPIAGLEIEGPLVEPGLESFVGLIPTPIRHGLTMGELAAYVNAEMGIGADLTVVEMRGWRRAMWFDQTGLPWVAPSPAMPHLSTATLYPGLCLLEGTNISEGRGSSLPFEQAGAPWIDGHSLARRMNDLNLPGVRFRPTAFEPASSKYAGQMCSGVQVHVTDRLALRPLALGLHLVAAIGAMNAAKLEWNAHFDRLAGVARVRQALAAAEAVEAMESRWQADLKRFAQQCQPYWLYN